MPNTISFPLWGLLTMCFFRSFLIAIWAHITGRFRWRGRLVNVEFAFQSVKVQVAQVF